MNPLLLIERFAGAASSLISRRVSIEVSIVSATFISLARLQILCVNQLLISFISLIISHEISTTVCCSRHLVLLSLLLWTRLLLQLLLVKPPLSNNILNLNGLLQLTLG